MSNEKNLPYAVVCGGVNIDIGAHSFAPLRAKDSNPGKVELSLGGVGRNIAHNMRLLGVPTYLLTAVGGDSRASQVEESCKELGIDLSHALRVPDGRVVTGKTSSLLGASAALLLNALKAMAGIRSDMNLISNQVIEPISALKIQSLGHHNPRLHSDEVLIALAISALTNPLADMARAQLGTLRGCDAHFSVIISEEDIKLYKRLGIHVSCEPKYESKRLYHK